MKTPALKVENLWVRYKKNYILSDVSFSVFPGTFLGIIGPNGAGKTTLFKAILGIIPYEKGKIYAFGQPVESMRQKIGYVPQISPQREDIPLTAIEFIELGLIGLGIKRNRCSTRIKDIVRLLEIENIERRRFSQLSIGQRQRVLFARALVKDPDILLLDEPTASMDDEMQKDVFSLLNEMKKKGKAIVMISHDIGVLSRFVDEVACLNKILVYHGTSGEQLGEGIQKMYSCPVDLLAHGSPHRVFPLHNDKKQEDI